MLNKNLDIPQNIMELEDDRFFKFVKQFSGEKVAVLLEFQDINNVECLMACKDPFEILTLDSDDLLDLKKKICVKLNNNTHAVLPGIKSKMNILKNSLVKKCNQFKKITSTTSLSNPVISSSFTTTSFNNNSTSSTDGSTQSLTNTHTSSNVILTTEEQIKQQLIKSLNDWCREMKENQNRQIIQLDANDDYEIIIDIKAGKVLIRCQCGATSTLGKKNNNYIVGYVFFSRMLDYFTAKGRETLFTKCLYISSFA